MPIQHTTTEVNRWPRRIIASALFITIAISLSACGSSSTASTTTTTVAPSTTTTLPPPPATLGHYLPLYPFSSAAQVSQWQQQHQQSGATTPPSPYASATQTAVSFASWLGFTGINTAVASVVTARSAHVTVGFHVSGSSSTVRSAIVHLVRWGSGAGAPWEVVGTDDTTLTVTAPAYGASSTAPATMGGAITGVDESIKVRARSLSSTSDLGSSCCSAAGGTQTPWSRTISFSAPSGTVVTLIAQTGGHVATVERFAVTGVTVK